MVLAVKLGHWAPWWFAYIFADLLVYFVEGSLVAAGSGAPAAARRSFSESQVTLTQLHGCCSTYLQLEPQKAIDE